MKRVIVVLLVIVATPALLGDVASPGCSCGSGEGEGEGEGE